MPSLASCCHLASLWRVSVSETMIRVSGSTDSSRLVASGKTLTPDRLIYPSRDLCTDMTSMANGSDHASGNVMSNDDANLPFIPRKGNAKRYGSTASS